MKRRTIVINLILIVVTLTIIGMVACKNIHLPRSVADITGSINDIIDGSAAIENKQGETNINELPAGEDVDSSVSNIEASSDEQNRINEIISQIITSNMGTLERIKAVHDYIVKNTYYDTTYEARGIYNVLYNHIGVCTGYSETFKLFMDTLGIPCVLVTGSGGGEGHEWNAVELEGSWYHIDVTWDDPLYNGSGSSDYPDGENLSYEYFLVPTSVIIKDHSISSSIGTSSSTQYNDWVLSLAKEDNLNKIIESVNSTGLKYAVVNNREDYITAVSEFYNNYMSDFYIIHDRTDTTLEYGNYPEMTITAVYNSSGYIANVDYEAFRLTDAVEEYASAYKSQGYEIIYVTSMEDYEQKQELMSDNGWYAYIFNEKQASHDAVINSFKEWSTTHNKGYSLQSGSISGSNGTTYIVRVIIK